MEGDFKYWAFISYSHVDKNWGRWLHGALEAFKVPVALAGGQGQDGYEVPSRIFPVFRDRDELPGGTNLGAVISKALKQSRFLVVICSPHAARSRWVNQEIIEFKKLGREDRILAFIVSGEPNAGDKKPGHPAEAECFPEALKYSLTPNGQVDKSCRTEPVAADARPGKDGKTNAKLKLLAGILGVNYDDLKQRDERRRRKQQRITIAISFACTLVFLGLAGVAWWQSHKAYINQLRLESQAAADEEARGQSDLLGGNVSDALKCLDSAYAVNHDKPSLKLMIAFALQKFAELTGSLEHHYGVTSSQFSPNGELIVTTDAEYVANIWRRNGVLANSITDTDGHIFDAVFTPDGKSVVTGCDSSNSPEKHGWKLWDAMSGTNVARIKTFGSVLLVAISPDNRLIAAVNRNNSVQIFNRLGNTNLLLLNELTNKIKEIKYVSFSPDSKLFVASRGDKIVVWDAANGKVKLALTSTNFSGFGSVAFNHNGSKLATTDGSATTILNARTGETIHTLLEPSHQQVCSAQFSPDDSLVIVGRVDGTASLWDGNACRLIHNLECVGGVVSPVLFSHDGRTAVTVNVSDIRMWSVPDGILKACFNLDTLIVKSASFSVDDSYLLTSGDNTIARVWNAKITNAPAVIDDANLIGALEKPIISPDGKKILASTEDGGAEVVDLNTGNKIRLEHTDRSQIEIEYAAFSPDSQLVAAETEAGITSLLDANTGKKIRSFVPDIGADSLHPAIYDVAFRQDGRLLVTGGGDGVARVYDVGSGREVASFAGSNAPLRSVAFDKTGRHIMALAHDFVNEFDPGAVYVWNYPTGKQPIIINGHTKEIITAKFSPAGDSILTASEDGTAKLWRTDNGHLVCTLTNHLDSLTGAAFNRNGSRIVTSSKDGSAKIWESDNGHLIASLNYGGWVEDAAFSPDGNYVATVGGNGFPVIWDAESGEALVVFPQIRDNWSGIAFTPDNRRLVVTAMEGKNCVWTVPHTQITPGELAKFVEKEITHKNLAMDQ